MRALLDRLPDTVTLQDIKVLEAETDTSGDISLDEMKRLFGEWLAE